MRQRLVVTRRRPPIWEWVAEERISASGYRFDYGVRFTRFAGSGVAGRSAFRRSAVTWSVNENVDPSAEQRSADGFVLARASCDTG